MYQFDISGGSKAELYRDLLAALDALTHDERDAVANMANAAALQNIIARYRDFCWNDTAGKIAILSGYNKTGKHSTSIS